MKTLCHRVSLLYFNSSSGSDGFGIDELLYVLKKFDMYL